MKLTRLGRIRPPEHHCSLPVVVCITIVLAFLLSACSTSSGHRYVDPRFHYSFDLPPGWVPPKKGTQGVTAGGYFGYIVHFVNPPGFRVVVGAPLADLTKVPNGRVLHGTRACPNRCTFYRLKVSGHPGLEDIQSDGTTILEVDVDVDAGGYGFEIEFPNYPALSKKMVAQFNHVIRSFVIPKKLRPH